MSTTKKRYENDSFGKIAVPEDFLPYKYDTIFANPFLFDPANINSWRVGLDDLSSST